MNGKVSLGGNLKMKVGRMPGPGVGWKVKNYSRPSFVYGYVSNRIAKQFSRMTGIPTYTAELRAIVTKADGTRVNYGLLSSRVVTTAFVEFVVDQLQVETTLFGDFRFHDSGIGTTAENITDTTIETTDGEARVSGTQLEGATANIYRSVGTITYTTTLAITEHGLFNDLTTGTLMDRSVFAAVNVVNTETITFEYELTIAAGG